MSDDSPENPDTGKAQVHASRASIDYRWGRVENSDGDLCRRPGRSRTRSPRRTDRFWSWLGVDYELDVSAANLDKIEQGKVTVAKLLKASTRVGGRRRSPSARTKTNSAGSGASVNASIRDWAAENGYEVSARGRIPNDIVEAYNSAH